MKTKKEAVYTSMATKYGMFNVWVWDGKRGQESVALSTPSLDPLREILLRIHSECITGDTFSSLSCDCGQQKDEALKAIAKHGNGILIYHRQEGRNIGLFKKIQAYNLMYKGLDTHDANIRISGSPDAREYSSVIQVLDELLHGKKSKITLLSNNYHKKLILEREGYPVVSTPLDVGTTFENREYAQTKRHKFLHYAPTFNPYVGATLFRKDLTRGDEVSKIVRTFDASSVSRKIFLGVPIYPQNGDLQDTGLAEELNRFAKHFEHTERVSIVLHLDYLERRMFYRELKSFLSLLSFRYSLQLRFEEKSISKKPDLDVIDSLQGEYTIFQLKRSQYALLENEKLVEYLQLNNTYLLLDESFGTGRQAHIERTQSDVMRVVKKGVTHVGVAGGYNSQKLFEVEKLEDYFKIPISVDAESKLRNGEKLNMEELQHYLGFFLAPAKY